jgi:hypothetical protein
MQGDREAAFRGQCQLLFEYLELFFQGCRTLRAGSQFDAPFQRLIEDPAVQSGLTQSGARRLVQTLDQCTAPSGGSGGDTPGVQAEGGNHRGAKLRQPPNLLPVALAGSIDHHASDAGSGSRRHPSQRIIAQPRILQVIMGVEPAHGDLPWDHNAPHCSSGEPSNIEVV